MSKMDRRTFLGRGMAALPLAGLLTAVRAPAAQELPMPPLVVFSKHLQFLDYKELASTCRALGVDGVDLTVRPGGHVLPERVKTDLPAAVEAIRAEGLDVPMITTRYLNAEEPEVREVFSTAKQCGVRYIRIGYHKYDDSGPILDQLDRVAAEVQTLARLAEEFDLTAGYHNHSGTNNVGAPVWDLHRVYEAVGSQRIGSNFDVGHAVAEGPFGDWQITARLLAPWVRMVGVKDFVFDGSHPRWVPLGEGIVDVVAFLRLFRAQAGFAGPVTLYFEYSVPSNDAMIEHVGKAVDYMRQKVYPEI